VRPLPSLDEMADELAQAHPLPAGLLPLVMLDLTDPDAPTAFRAILATAKDARVRLRQVGRSLGDPEAIATDTDASLLQYGFRRLHAAAVISLLTSAMDSGTNALDAVAYWRRSVCVSFCSTLLVRDDAPEAGLTTAAGMLYQIGFLLLDTDRSDLTAMLPSLRTHRGGLDADGERAILGYALHELSAVILQRWGLPAAVVTAVLERERGPLEQSRLGRALWTSVEGSYTLGFGGRFYPQRRELDPRLQSAIESFYGSTAELVRRVDRVLAGAMLDEPIA